MKPLQTLSSCLLVAMTAGAGLTVAPVGQADSTEGEWREVIVSHTDDYGVLQLYRVKEDGSDRRQLTHSEQGCRMPACSPDGNKLVYVQQVGHNLALWASDLDGKNTRVLTDEGMNLVPSWLPDSVHIVWMKTQPGQDPGRNSQIYLMNTETGESQRLFTDPEQLKFSNSMPVVSPKGDRIAFVSNRSGLLRIWVSDLDGSNARPISPPEAEFHEAIKAPIEQKVPAWSPDGKWIAHWEGVEVIHLSKFTGVPNPERDRMISATFHVWVVDSEGNSRRKVGRGDDPTWAPDGFVTRAFPDPRRGGPMIVIETESGEKELPIVPPKRSWGRFTWLPRAAPNPTNERDDGSSGTGSRHLVLDARKIARTSNVKQVLGKIHKHPANPLFGEDKPWEQRFDNFYGSIVYEEDKKQYRLWWNPFIYDPDEGADERENGLEYAYSSDGINWTKPNLGLVEFEGSTKNNLINRDSGHGHGVFKDPHEPDPAKRYKMIARKSGVSIAYSTDGLHWSDWIPAFKAKADTHNNAIWAPTLNKYVAISRQFEGEGKTRRRVVARSESDDFLSGWSDVETVMDGGADFQTYANAIFYHAGVYLGLVAIFDTSDGPTDNKVWTELAWSPDTKHWYRVCKGTPFIPNSDVEGDPDWGTAYACLNPLFRDTDEVRIYYGGGDGKHNRYRDGYLMLATIRKDRWAGYEAEGEGTVETVPVKCEGANLFVCVDVKPGGSVRAEVVGVEGLSARDCNGITMDVSDGKLTWSEKNLEDLIGRAITLRFHLNKATLYSFVAK